MNSTVSVKVLKINELDGLTRTRGGIYVPSQQSIKETLDRLIIPPDRIINYIPMGRELENLKNIREARMSALLVGPTGIGKSMLAERFAQLNGLPFLRTFCNPDQTEGQLMGIRDSMHIAVEINGTAQLIHIPVFFPSNISIAGLSGQPVVMFVDEFHRIRSGMDVLYHPLVHERIVDLTVKLGPGAVYPLHPETMVIFALNPYYRDGGIEKIGPAMRRRLVTFYFPMITDEKKLLEIVRANVVGFEKLDKDKLKTIDQIIKMITAVSRVYLAYNKRAAEDTDDLTLKSELQKALPDMIEAPSPGTLVSAVRLMVQGEEPLTALRLAILNTVADDFDGTVGALLKVAETMYSIK